MSTVELNYAYGLHDLVADIRDAFSSWNLRRETRLALSRLSERQLEDIGLNRADIDTVLSRI